MTSRKPSLNISQWRVELMRLTAFTSEDFGANADQWWQTVMNTPPETKTEKPRESTRSFEGHLGNVKLVLSAVVNRVDWILGFDITLDQEYEGTPNIGPYEQILDQFGATLSPWLSSCPPLFRLAWGAALVYPVDDRVVGYRILKKYLPTVDIDVENSSDFTYQINRPCPSKVIPDLRINRLQKWSVLQMHHIAIPIVAPSGKPPPAVSSAVPSRTACRAELDINTAADRTSPIPANKVMALYSEMLELGKEIASRGDQK